MSKRASPTAIGAFVLGAVALIVGGLLVWGSTDLFRRALVYVIWFDGSVAGLRAGAPVEFRGVKLGEVIDIHLKAGTSAIPVYVDLDTRQIRGIQEGDDPRQSVERAIQAGLRAQLRVQSLVTGQLYVALDMYPGTPIKLVGLDPDTPEIPAVPTVLEQWTDRAKKVVDALEKLPLEQMVTHAAETLEGINRLVRSPELTRAVRSTETLVADARTLVRDLGQQVGPLAASTRQTLEATRATVNETALELRHVLKTVDTRVAQLGSRVGGAAEGASALLADARQLVRTADREIGPLAASVRSTADAARATLDRARATLGDVDGLLEAETRLGYELSELLQQLTATSRSLRALTDYLERRPDALFFGRGRPGPR
jgi:paraquat-inducible protein B